MPGLSCLVCFGTATEVEFSDSAWDAALSCLWGEREPWAELDSSPACQCFDEEFWNPGEGPQQRNAVELKNVQIKLQEVIKGF